MKTLRVIALTLFFSSNASAAILPKIEDFAKNDLWLDVKVSPNGDYISAISYFKGKRVIVLHDAKTMKILYSLSFSGYAQPGEYSWANDERIVVEKVYLKGWQDQPVSYGEYFAVNANGRRTKYIFGHKNSSGSLSKNMWGKLIDPLPDEHKYVLLKATTMSKTHEKKPKLYRVNIYKGSKKEIAESPVSFGRFLTDSKHNVRFVSGTDENNQTKTFLYKNDKWLSTKDAHIGNESFNPISIQSNSNIVYATYSEKGEPAGLYQFDLDAGTKIKIYQHKNVAVSNVKIDDNGDIFALEYDDGFPSIKIIDKENAQSKILLKLMKRLKGNSLSIVSESRDRNIKIIFVYNQFNPGEYLHYDVKKDELGFLFAKRPWVDTNISANVVPIKFKARDGLELSAYVTLPLGADTLEQAKNLPFVVNVHGGPHGVRDFMSYDADNQLYASRGIGVLQVNYRGSGGYGWNFEKLGYLHWGDNIQFDIIDGINYLIKKNVADRNRLCIVGYSFGGYSALQSSIIEPELFKCAVGKMGVYDLALMHEIGDIQKRSSGKAYLKDAIGLNKEELKLFSPIYNLDKLKASVFIIHGGEDKQVPIEHAEMLIEGLKKHKIEHEWMILDEEGHGFFKPKHRAKVYTRVIKFLKDNL